MIDKINYEIDICYYRFQQIYGMVSVTDLYKIFMYYAIDMMIFYKNNANNILPKSIVIDIINQVMTVAKLVSSDFREEERVNRFMNEINNKIYEKNIITETSLFMALFD